MAVARFVTDYEFNNAYQYVINREDVHLAWLEAAIGDLGGKPADVALLEEIRDLLKAREDGPGAP